MVSRAICSAHCVSFLIVLLCLTVLDVGSSAAQRGTPPEGGVLAPERLWEHARPGESFPGTRGVTKARADTFYVYGGPGSQEGRFETATGAPDWQDWTTTDLTEIYPHWRASTTNAATLGGGAPENHAVICHNDPIFGLETYYGYGNDWDDWLVLRLDLTALGYDPSQDSVELRWGFDYVHDVEWGYDYLLAEWNKAGAYQIVLAATGSSYDDSTGVYEPVRFDSDPITLSPADYVNGEVQLRIRVYSDGAWSDADDYGGFTTEGRGAGAVDDIEVYLDEVLVSSASWEPLSVKADLPPGTITGHDNGAGTGTEGWRPTPSSFVGDFAKLFAGFQDIDPCYENRSWQLGFIDDATPPRNDSEQRSTGGSVSPTWSYGVPGGWVVNYTGGLTNGTSNLNNRALSPVIDWDLPGTEDDGAWGCIMSLEGWVHLPLTNCMFFTFEMRTWTSIEGWSDWMSPGVVYFWPYPQYGRFTDDMTRLLTQNPEKFQLRVGMIQYPFFSFCNPTDATPAALFDNLYVQKYVLHGPLMFLSNGFQMLRTGRVEDAFPTDGTTEGAIRWDWIPATDDSVVVEMRPVNPGTQLADPIHGGTMRVALLANPEFGDHTSGARSAALQSLGAVVAGQDSRGWPIYTFGVLGQQVTWSDGRIAENLYFFDIPDGPAHPEAPHQVDEDPLFFRGDVIHYYFESTDDAGGTGHLPADITGFLDFEVLSGYKSDYIVRGLPNMANGSPPKVLFWDRARGSTLRNLGTLGQAGLQDRVDVEYYAGAWLAGREGMSLEQMANYELIFVNDTETDSTDFDMLQQWRQEDGNRQIVWMGRNAAGEMYLESTGSGLSFLTNVLGVDYLNDSVSDFIDDQRTPTVSPVLTCYDWPFDADQNCPVGQEFNYVRPTAAGAEISHEFLDRSGDPYLSAVPAGIFWRQESNGFDRSTAFFPLALADVWTLNEGGPTPDGASARARLVRQVLQCMYMEPGDAVDTGAPPLRFSVAQNVPNPFNPNTRIAFTVARREHVELVVYDVQGRVVRTLIDEPRKAGRYFVDWDSTDDSGSRVASGIYHYRLRAGSFEESRRMVLIK